MGYKEAPWAFSGKALYQLQLIKSDLARKYVPAEFDLVELFGHTLGGFYLARYTDSPVGAFDELVILGGLVWNPPTSCAWAARVYVNNKEAKNHGLKHIGLPSCLAHFTTNHTPSSKLPISHNTTWWGMSDDKADSPNFLSVRNIEHQRRFHKRRSFSGHVCVFVLNNESNVKWNGPRLNLKLPSFSGATAVFPNLVQYSCQLLTNVRPVKPLVVLGFEESQDKNVDGGLNEILKGKPICAFEFNNMRMVVEEPKLYKKLSKAGVGKKSVFQMA